MKLYKDNLKGKEVPLEPEEMKRFMKTGAEIKNKLGENRDLFDIYLTLIKNFSDSLSDDFTNEVLDNIGDAYGMFIVIIQKKKKTEYRNNALYCHIKSFLKEYLKTHPFTNQDEASDGNLYFLGLLKELSVNLVVKFIAKHAEELKGELKELKIKERYKELCEKAGKELMDKFNQQARSVFYSAFIDKCYFDGALSYILYVMHEIEQAGYGMRMNLFDYLVQEGKTI